MCPTFNNNDYVICALWPGVKVKKNSLVIVSHPRLNTIIKRVQSIDKAGRIGLSGDNMLSMDTQALGWVEKSDVLGKVVLHIKA